MAILITTTIDYWMAYLMDKTEKYKKLFLVISLSMNLGLLFYFKYCNFFVDNINTALAWFGIQDALVIPHIILPIGISFYTFESITYLVDIYRGEHKPLKRFWDYLLYILFFPKLIAGPIIRYQEIEHQLTNRFDTDTIDNKLNGLFRFFIGLAKKVLIANIMAEQADKIFALSGSELDTLTAWSGALFYTFQIYFDFSGYSDMAIGLALLFGFRLTENFSNPYTSSSITEFWRRWHITLGNWMRNYLYIPLGGNRVNSKYKLFFNLWFVFLCSGFWHGANWTFILWGAFHGIFLILDRLFLLNFYKHLPKFISIILTFIIVVIGWVLFRSDNSIKAFEFIRTMFEFKISNDFISYFEPKVIYTFAYAAFFSFIWDIPYMKQLQDKILFDPPGITLSLFKTIIGIFIFIICMGALASNSFNPFIYFRF
ncbi:MAG: MBOAT family O-acyltransferase [Sediminibacterium sp.]|nr:MBOAT family O-acyltransferase [Sediminibacterium sp.]